ncbi:MAG: threonine/serine exporter family protein [Rikenellaceae bacterium]
MEGKSELVEVADLLLDVATSLMGAGSHTARAVRSVSRMAGAFGYEIFITIFQKNMTMMVRKKGCTESITLVRNTKHMALNFRVVSELSSLSWSTHDHKLTLKQAREHYDEIMAQPRLSRWVVLFLVACANASFCKLFSGDLISCVMVFIGTLSGFYLRQELMARDVPHTIVFVVAAFTSSIIAGLCYLNGWGTTPDTAMATSVLFLIPGVPLINSIMDVLEGHVLTGISRMVNATTLIVAISIGFMFTLLCLGIEKF